jgi:hypothetical protein
MNDKQIQMEIDAGPTTAAALQLIVDQQKATQDALNAMALVLGAFVRSIDGGTSSRAVPGSMKEKMLAILSQTTSVIDGGVALDCPRAMLEKKELDYTPRPPDGGSHVRIVAASDSEPVIAGTRRSA